jgi:hypothetical protein
MVSLVAWHLVEEDRDAEAATQYSDPRVSQSQTRRAAHVGHTDEQVYPQFREAAFAIAKPKGEKVSETIKGIRDGRRSVCIIHESS